MPELEPITREEMLLDGQDLEPITRKEMFIKRIYDKTQVIPEPITREEIFLKKAGDETTDVTIEQLSVSENGTYSEEGVAYSPVIVNVPAPPIPENAYLLNEVEGLPKDIVTFTDGSNLPMPSLKVGIEPQQDLSHGDPSPSNICPISGWDEVNVTRAGKNLFDKTHYKFVKSGYINSGGAWEGSTTILSYPTDALSGYWNSPMIDIEPFRGMTLSYSGFVSVAGTARGIVDKDFNVLATLGNSAIASNTIDLSQYPTAKYLVLTFIASDYNFDNAQLNIGSTPSTYEPYNGQTHTIDLDGTRYGGTLDVISGVLTLTDGYIASYNGETLPSTWISDRDVYAEGATPTTGAEVCYKLATPLTIQLTPTAVKSLLGSNNVWADTGEIEELEYFSKEV